MSPQEWFNCPCCGKDYPALAERGCGAVLKDAEIARLESEVADLRSERDEKDQFRLNAIAERDALREKLAAAEEHCRNHHLEPCETCMATETERNVAESQVSSLRRALEEVEAWDLRWAEGLDENVERIKAHVREALRGEGSASHGEPAPSEEWKGHKDVTNCDCLACQGSRYSPTTDEEQGGEG